MSKRVFVLVGTDKGLFMFESDAARRDWTLKGPHLPGWELYSVLGDSRSKHRLLAGTHHRTGGATIQISDDFGATWRPAPVCPQFAPKSDIPLRRFWQLTPGHASMPHTFYAGSEDAGLFVSHDRGETWEEVRGLSEHPTRPHWGPGAGGMGLHTILVHPENPDRMWVAASCVGVLRSDDGGETWQVRNKGLNPVPTGRPEEENIGYCAHKVALDPNDPDVLYMQDHGAVNKSVDGGDSWFRIEKGLGAEGDDRFGFPIAAAKTGDLYLMPLKSSEERVMRGGRMVMFRSTDRGASWQPVKGDFPSTTQYVNVLRDGLVCDDLDPYGVYFGSSSGELFYSLDRGDSWQALPGRFPRITTVKTWVVEE
ncbi:MAG TPA: exo-alpha-sialidase [Limnochordia bacterium]|nr:exo-alpha-sialidase [Limnochordia bacterium]